MMEWILVENQNDIPKGKTLIVEDCNGWIGQAYYVENYGWVLETFNQTTSKIIFDEIIKYLIINQ